MCSTIFCSQKATARGRGVRKDRTDLPSAAATPSRLFKRPLKLNVEPSFASAEVVVVEGLVVDVVAVGVPVEVENDLHKDLWRKIHKVCWVSVEGISATFTERHEWSSLEYV